MAKKPAPAKPPVCDKNQHLVEAVKTVRQIQEFIKHNGGLEQAVCAVGRVRDMVELSGGFQQLSQALEIVGREETPQA